MDLVQRVLSSKLKPIRLYGIEYQFKLIEGGWRTNNKHILALANKDGRTIAHEHDYWGWETKDEDVLNLKENSGWSVRDEILLHKIRVAVRNDIEKDGLIKLVERIECEEGGE